MENAIIISKKEAKELIRAWIGHKREHTDSADCNKNCPVNNFFMELKSKL